MSKSNQRRIVLIDNRFQLRMAAAFILIQVVLTALFAAVLYIFMDSELHAELATAHASYQSLRDVLLPIIVLMSVFSLLLSVVLTVIFVVLLSHKIAGPMYRFRVVLESPANRRFDQHTGIRPNDQLGEVAESLDKAVRTVKADIHQLHQSVWKLRECHAKSDTAGYEAEMAAMERTLETWEKN